MGGSIHGSAIGHPLPVNRVGTMPPQIGEQKRFFATMGNAQPQGEVLKDRA
jgi:hypothetical protein